jgi:hypothetical protein
MINLDRITLVAFTSIRIDETIAALNYSCRGINFAKVKLLSDIRPENLPNHIQHEFVPRCSNIDEWNYHIIYTLPKHIDTDFCILIHDNGFIVNPELWRNEFFEYDYIGAPWPIPNDNFSYRDINGELIRQGNSVSLRSKKLLDVAISKNLEWKSFHGFSNEDGFICVNYRHEYINAGCKFADINVAKFFSKETEISENKDIETFAFHNYSGSNIKYPKFNKKNK